MIGNTNTPLFENVPTDFEKSFLIKHYSHAKENATPNWHFHPEIELVFVKGGSGKRHIGNHLSCYWDGDLILIGSGLPHYGFTDSLTGHSSETIVQMKESFLGTDSIQIPEMKAIHQLLERAKQGLVFHGKTKEMIGGRIEKLTDRNHFECMLELFAILNELAQSDEYMLLNARSVALEVKQADDERINSIYKYVRRNFQQVITLDEIAAEVSMTVPAFCRYFKKQSGKTFVQFVNEFRVVHACKLLSETPSTITDVCFESGFHNISNFNKTFKETTGQTPSQYRAKVKKVIH